MVKKTKEQLIAYHQEQIKRLQKQAKAQARKERAHRLVASAAKIEAVSGLELNEALATFAGEYLAKAARIEGSVVWQNLNTTKGQNDAH